MKIPAKLTTFLPTGDPTGTKIIELAGWVGKSYVIPRAELKKMVESRDELASQGVYFLIGEDDSAQRTVYIGEAENLATRLKQHYAGKDFWQEVICFLSKDDNLTKAHVKYLESLSVEIAFDLRRSKILNTTTPTRSRLPEADIAEMEEFLNKMRFVLSVAGFRFLEDATDSSDKVIFYIKDRKADARAIMTNEGIVILAGSKISAMGATKSADDLWEIWSGLEGEGILEKVDGQYIFKKDYVSTSPSKASGIVLGRASNGWTSWKDAKGNTMDDLMR